MFTQPQRYWLAALTRIEPLDVQRAARVVQQRLATDNFVKLLLGKFVGPIAYWNIARDERMQELAFSPSQRERLRQQYVATTAHFLRIQNSAETTQRVLRQAGIRHLFFKGFASQLQLYPHPGLRPMCDVDVWVEATHFNDAVQGLQTEGFGGSPTTTAPFVAQLARPAWASVDVHAYVRQVSRVAIPFDDVYARGTDVSADGGHYRIPSPIDMFLLQIYSMAANELNSFLSLVDLRQLLLRHPDVLSDPRLLQRCQRWGLRNAAWFVLCLLGVIYPELDVLRFAKAIEVNKTERFLLQHYLDQLLSQVPAKGALRLRQIAVKLLMVDGWRRRFDFGQEHAWYLLLKSW